MGPGPAPWGDPRISAYAHALIRLKARQLSAKPGFRVSDEPDLEHDLAVALLMQIDGYDPGRGASRDTFANRIVESAAKMILRSRSRLKRAAGFRVQRLEPDFDLAATQDPTKDPEAVDTALAINRVVSALPTFHAAVAGHLRERSEAATARELGVSRRQVRAAVAEIRRRFEDAGLNFLSDSRTGSGGTA